MNEWINDEWMKKHMKLVWMGPNDLLSFLRRLKFSSSERQRERGEALGLAEHRKGRRRKSLVRWLLRHEIRRQPSLTNVVSTCFQDVTVGHWSRRIESSAGDNCADNPNRLLWPGVWQMPIMIRFDQPPLPLGSRYWSPLISPTLRLWRLRRPIYLREK